MNLAKKSNIKELTKEGLKKQEGITLIALIVTIIVLLILARNLNNNVNGAKPEY